MLNFSHQYRLAAALSFVIVAGFLSHSLHAEESLSAFQRDLVNQQKSKNAAGKSDTLFILDKEKTPGFKSAAKMNDGFFGKFFEKKTAKPAPMPSVSHPAAKKIGDADKLMKEVVQKDKIQAPGKAFNPFFLKPKAVKAQEKKIEIKLDPYHRPAKDEISLLHNVFPWFGGRQYYIYKEKQFTETEAAYTVAVSDKRISMKEAIEIGLTNSMAAKAAKKRVEVARSKLTEARRALFPTVQAVIERNGGKVGGRLKNNIQDQNPLADLETNASGREYKGESQKINITQPLFYGGELVLTVKQAEQNLKSAEADFQKSKFELIHQIRVAYVTAVKAEYNAQYQTELAKAVEKLHRNVLKQNEQKLISQIDYLNVESQYQQVLFQSKSAKSDLLSSRMLLRQAVGMDDGRPLPVELRLDVHRIDPQYEDLVRIALKNNPEVKVRLAALESARLGVRIFTAKKYPRIDLRGSYGRLGEAYRDDQAKAQSLEGDLDTEKEWFIGVQGSMPIGPNSVEYSTTKNVYGPTVLALTGSEAYRHRLAFNFLDKFSEITDEKSAQALLLQTESELDKAENDTKVKVRDDFYTLQKSLIQLDSSIARTQYQEKQNAILEYMMGLQETTPSNYIEGLIEHAQDRFAFVQAVTDYDIAVSSLSVSVGDPYYFEDKS